MLNKKTSRILMVLTIFLSSLLFSFHYSFIHQDSSPIISYIKTRCMGSCPSYQFKVFPDGSAQFVGEAFVDRMGTWTSELNENKLRQLKNLFTESDFFSFEERYYQAVSDLPTTYLFFKDEDEKKVMDYYGAPEQLKALERQIEIFIEELDWVKLEE